MLAPDPLHGHVAEGQIEFASEPRGAKGGQLLAQSKDLLFDFRRSFQRVTMRSAAVFFQTAGTVLLIAPPPLTDRKPASSEQPCGGFNTAFFDRLDQAKPMVVSVFHLTHQVEVTDGSSHSGVILLAASSPALPLAGLLSPSSASRSNTSTSPGGNDVPFQFHCKARLASAGTT